MATTVPPILADAPGHARTAARASAWPWHLAAVVLANSCIVAGLVWDISWHMTIGRDTFWTPAHLLIYTGGAMAAGVSGLEVLRRWRLGAAAPADGVRVVGPFRGPLGGWLAIWGGVAMLTSAPFDDWWHNAYGLDVRIVSPPHTVLALGFLAILLGALVMAASAQHRAKDADATGTTSPWVVAYVMGIWLVMVTIFTTQAHDRTLMHSAGFYAASALAYPKILLAALRTVRLRWAATAVAGVFTLLLCLQAWILPLFPGSPLLGPIRTPVTHMVNMDFPLLLLFPAIALDLLWPRLAALGAWAQAAITGAVFTAVHVATQWPFATLLMSPLGRTPFFAADNIPYQMPPTWLKPQGLFQPEPRGATVAGLALAVGLAILSARAGLGIGNWLRTVRR
ncbi:MAG: hypothetical protein KJT01_11735 [Gemmatimonadetes bacterium]|nr:hypothetical protein [Gemmatimonadota bacterium]